MSLETLQIAFRSDSAADWTSNNPTLIVGEVGYESDTGLYKIGDGSTAWNALVYKQTPIVSVADITARNALTPFNGQLTRVTDASADSSVTSGWAIYYYNGSTWIKTISEETQINSNPNPVTESDASTVDLDLNNNPNSIHNLTPTQDFAITFSNVPSTKSVFVYLIVNVDTAGRKFQLTGTQYGIQYGVDEGSSVISYTFDKVGTHVITMLRYDGTKWAIFPSDVLTFPA